VPLFYRVGAAGGGLAVSSVLKPLVLRLPKVNEGEEAGTRQQEGWLRSCWLEVEGGDGAVRVGWPWPNGRGTRWVAR
jgi:hypothetical protein